MGCCHCFKCLPIALTYELCDLTRRKHIAEPYEPWWPAFLDSPTIYYALKRRSFSKLCEQAHTLQSDRALWRTAAETCSPLASRRGCRQLSLRLPVARTNLSADEEAPQFVRCILLEQQAPTTCPPSSAAATWQPQAQQGCWAKSSGCEMLATPPLAAC